jgi:hypothetical protein
LVGPVTGFLVEGPDGDRAYVSGDNASVAVVGRLAARVGPLTAVVLFAGAARPPYLPRLRLTLTADRAVRAAHALGSAPVALLHFEDWAHFTEGAGEVRAAFDSAGLGDRLVVPARGQTVAL